MNQIQVNSIICSHCDESFLSRGKYQSHYIQKHQNEIRIDQDTIVFRTEGGKFMCFCEKEFELSQSLKRHYGSCIKAHEKELENEQSIFLLFILLINR